MDPILSEQTDPRKPPVERMPAAESESVKSATKELSTLLEPCGKATLVGVPVDPYVVHCQWEIAPADIEAAKRALGVGEHEYWPVLQFYDVTNTPGDKTAGYASFSVEVQLGAGNWYVRSCSPDRAYRANLALKGEDGSLAVIASSDRVETPPSAPSSYADEHWLPIRMSPQRPEGTALLNLPIDMSAEVRNKLAALYGERDRDFLEPLPEVRNQLACNGREDGRIEVAAADGDRDPEVLALRGLSRLPIDMREEVRTLLSRLYQGLEQGSTGLTGRPLVMEDFPVQRISTMKHGAVADLTELNERSFKSGVSSKAK